MIREPQDEQIDSFEKLEFYPGALFYLSRVARELDFELVMVTNQDGLGTKAFPEETFHPVHNLIIKTFANEGVVFDKQFIDRASRKTTRLTGSHVPDCYRTIFRKPMTWRIHLSSEID